MFQSDGGRVIGFAIQWRPVDCVSIPGIPRVSRLLKHVQITIPFHIDSTSRMFLVFVAEEDIDVIPSRAIS